MKSNHPRSSSSILLSASTTLDWPQWLRILVFFCLEIHTGCSRTQKFVNLNLVSSRTQPDDKLRLHGEEETRTHENHTASTQVGDEGGGKEKKPRVRVGREGFRQLRHKLLLGGWSQKHRKTPTFTKMHVFKKNNTPTSRNNRRFRVQI